MVKNEVRCAREPGLRGQTPMANKGGSTKTLCSQWCWTPRVYILYIYVYIYNIYIYVYNMYIYIYMILPANYNLHGAHGFPILFLYFPIFLLSILPMASYKDRLSKEALSPHDANGLPHLHRALLRADKNWKNSGESLGNLGEHIKKWSFNGFVHILSYFYIFLLYVHVLSWDLNGFHMNMNMTNKPADAQSGRLGSEKE